jgi:hypothetical protein
MDVIQKHYKINEKGTAKVISNDFVELGHKSVLLYGLPSEDLQCPTWIQHGEDIYDLITPSYFGPDQHLYCAMVGFYGIYVRITNLPRTLRADGVCPREFADVPYSPRVYPAPEEVVNNEEGLALRGFPV